MNIDIVSILPGLVQGFFQDSIMKRALDAGHVTINYHNPRDYATDKHKQADDYQFGGGAGMVLKPEPLASLLDDLLSKKKYDEVIYMTPEGETLNQKTVNRYSGCKNIIIICGHYKGIDQRIRDLYVTKEISIGDYVLSGGEPAAAIFCDAVIRLIPGVLNNETSALSDSFQDDLLAPPVYTRPADFRGHKVPEVLLSGNFKRIEDWRYEKALENTKKRRPDLLKDNNKNNK